MTLHIDGVNGCRKDQPPEFNSWTATTTSRPDEVYGCVKSTILVLLVVIEISPTAPSKFYNKRSHQLKMQEINKGVKQGRRPL